MAVKPAMHGRDHCLGGADPIPCWPESTSVPYAAPYYIPVREVWSGTNQIEANGFSPWVIDATYPGGGYTEATLDAKYISWNVLLGPKGSIWSWLPMLGFGSDYAKVSLQLQTAPPGVFYTPTEGTFTNDALGTWYTLETVDCYSASGGVWLTQSVWKGFRIMGDVGVAGTGFTVGNYPLEWDGGPGPHRIRILTDGQNASSSGFRCRISGLVLVQFDDTNLP